MSCLIPLLFLLAIVFVLEGIYLLTAKSTTAVQLMDYATNTNREPKLPYFERGIRPRAKRLAQRLPYWKGWITPADIETRLAYAGEPYGLDSNQFYGLQLLTCLVCSFYGFIIGGFWARQTGMLLGFVIGGVLGIFLPILWLNNKAQSRQAQISIAVPDSLDLLATSMDAGLGFDIALPQVAARMTGPLADEWNRFIRELQMGIPRQECFMRLIRRNSSAELRNVVAALLQAHELGAPISQTLQDQAEQMRARRIQLAKEAGAKAGPRITLVTTMIMAPTIMCLLVAIVALKVRDNLGPLLQEFVGR